MFSLQEKKKTETRKKIDDSDNCLSLPDTPHGPGVKLYFPLAEERNKWKMFSHTPLGPGPEGLLFESHAQCLSVAVLLSAIADVYFWAPVPTQPFIKLITYNLFVRYYLLRLSTWSLTKLITVALYYCILPTLLIMLGCIGLRNKTVSWRRSVWLWLPEVCEKSQFSQNTCVGQRASLVAK